MGSDALVNVWVGLELQDEDDWDEDDEREAEVQDQLNFLQAEIDRSPSLVLKQDDGLEYEFFHTGAGELRCGFGVSLLHHDWDSDPMQLNLAALAQQAEALLVKVQKKFEEWGLPDPHVWLQTDYF